MDRILPQNLSMEKGVLGALMLSPSLLLDVHSKLPNPKAFYNGVNRLIYEAILTLSEDSGVFDPTFLAEYLRSTGDLEQVGGISYLSEVASESFLKSQVEPALKILQDKYFRRTFIISFGDSVEKMYEDKDPFSEVLTNFYREISMKDFSYRTDLIRPEDFTERRIEGLKERMSTPRILTGTQRLDNLLTLGFSPLGNGISVIAGRPSMGKSAFRANLTANLCSRGFGVLSVTPEQGFDLDSDRMDALITGIPLREILGARNWRGEEAQEKIEKIQKSQELMSKWGLFYLENKGISLGDIRIELNQIINVLGRKIDVVFVDLFDKLADTNVGDNRHSAISKALGIVAEMSQKFQCHFCLLVQISRQAERRASKRPSLVDLKDSGTYEQDADLVFLLHREGWYRRADGEEDVDDSTLEVSIAKQRNGVSGVRIELSFDSETLRISDPEGEEPNFVEVNGETSKWTTGFSTSGRGGKSNFLEMNSDERGEENVNFRGVGPEGEREGRGGF